MPRNLREEKLPNGWSVALRERVPGESYATRYAVQTMRDGRAEWAFTGCWGFSDDLGYMNRKYDNVLEDLQCLT